MFFAGLACVTTQQTGSDRLALPSLFARANTHVNSPDEAGKSSFGRARSVLEREERDVLIQCCRSVGAAKSRYNGGNIFRKEWMVVHRHGAGGRE